MAAVGAINAGSRGPSTPDGVSARRPDSPARPERAADRMLSPASREVEDRMREAHAQMAGKAPAVDRGRAIERVVSQRGDAIRSASARNVEMRQEQRVGRRDGVPRSEVSVPAADNLRTRMAIEAARSADSMTEMATQRALREYNAG